MCYDAGNGGRRHDSRAGEEDLTLLRSHPTTEVAIGAADGDFALCWHTQVVSHARPATWALDCCWPVFEMSSIIKGHIVF